jgi:hypothetical protein
MIVSTTLIALAIRLAGFTDTTACTLARSGWCSTSSVAALPALSSAFGSRTPSPSVYDVGAITPLDAQNAPGQLLGGGARVHARSPNRAPVCFQAEALDSAELGGSDDQRAACVKMPCAFMRAISPKNVKRIPEKKKTIPEK